MVLRNQFRKIVYTLKLIKERLLFVKKRSNHCPRVSKSENRVLEKMEAKK